MYAPCAYANLLKTLQKFKYEDKMVTGQQNNIQSYLCQRTKNIPIGSITKTGIKKNEVPQHPIQSEPHQRIVYLHYETQQHCCKIIRKTEHC